MRVAGTAVFSARMASSPHIFGWIVLYFGSLYFQAAFSACPNNWLTVNTTATPAQTCYRIFPGQSQTFDGASKFCQNLGGYLARDTSAPVHNALRPNVVAQSNTHQNIRFWFGLTDNNAQSGQWVWLGGGNVGPYTDFSSHNTQGTQNKRDCGYLLKVNNDFKWFTTINCNQTIALICQRDYNAPALMTTTTQPVNCPNGWTGFPTQHWCIQTFTNRLAWPAARQYCRGLRSDLVRINNTAMYNFVNGLINKQKGIYWIGLNDRVQEGHFVWLDDKGQANFTKWDAGRPNGTQANENCVATDANKGDKWDDLDCSTPNRFICQMGSSGGRPFRTPGPTPSHVNCGYGWEDIPGQDTCAYFSTNVLTWLDAQADCISRQGKLASVANGQEQSYFSGRIATMSTNLFWIGANDRATEKGWVWSDGTPFAYLNWDVRQPDNSGNSDCAVLIQRNGRWDDIPCQARVGYICKKRGATTRRSAVTTTTPPAHLPSDKIFGCPGGWENYRGSCYKVIQMATAVSWSTASSTCASPSNNGNLAAIIDADENKFILSLLPKGYKDMAWIGFGDPQENTFTWSDGTPVQYTNWDLGQPNNINNEDCVAMRATNGRWNDVQCANTYTVFICKKNKSIVPRAGSDEEQGCTNGSLGYGAQCYSFITPAKNFNDAQKDCKARSKNLGNLATVDSGHLQAFLAAQIYTLPGSTYWIGLQQNNYAYIKWLSGWPVSFTYWGQNHTGNERYTCVGMQKSGLWANYNCGQMNMSYICESPRTGFTTATTKAPLTNQGRCPTGWTANGPSCYQAFFYDLHNVSKQLSWTEARDFCASQATGGSLVVINNNATQIFLTTLMRSNNDTGSFWIGLNDRDIEASFMWADNSPFLYSNWNRGEPNNQNHREDCVEMLMPSGVWNDNYCYTSNSWICQVPRGSVITTPKPAPTGTYSARLCGNSSWILQNNHCYFVSPDDGYGAMASWYDARQICISMRSDLASITGEDENGFITTQVSKTRMYSLWIGLNDLYQDTMQWTDRSPVSYVSWAINEPDNSFGEESCVSVAYDGTWSDNQCSSKLGYVCKKWAGNYHPTPYTPPPPTGGCPTGFVTLPALSYCYRVGGTTNTTRANYSIATTACQQTPRGQLASIHSGVEEKFIVTLLANVRRPAWIGFNDRYSLNRFEWIDNLPVTYTNWAVGQPDEDNYRTNNFKRDCVDIELRRSIDAWYDRSCTTPQAYICEARKDPTLPTLAPNTTGCHAGYQRYQNSCYKFYKDSYDYASAETICRGDGAYLVTVNSGAEQAFVEIVTGHVNDSLPFWLGLQYSQGSSNFKWQDGWPVWYTNWGQGEPNTNAGQRCVVQILDGQWHVINCTTRRPFVCEINLGSPVPPTRPSRVYVNCPDRTWYSYMGNCYHLESTSLKSWSAARAACTALGSGSTLASIHSQAEANTLTRWVANAKHDVWIGLFQDQATGFAWTDSSELEFLNWEPGEPNDPDRNLHQDCGKMLSKDGKWADTDCFDENAYLCKISNMLASAQTGSSISGGSIAGIIIGTLILVTIVAIVGFLLFKRRNVQITSPFRKQPLPNPEPGFDNASYSATNGVQLNASEA